MARHFAAGLDLVRKAHGLDQRRAGPLASDEGNLNLGAKLLMCFHELHGRGVQRPKAHSTRP